MRFSVLVPAAIAAMLFGLLAAGALPSAPGDGPIVFASGAPPPPSGGSITSSIYTMSASGSKLVRLTSPAAIPPGRPTAPGSPSRATATAGTTST